MQILKKTISADLQDPKKKLDGPIITILFTDVIYSFIIFVKIVRIMLETLNKHDV